MKKYIPLFLLLLFPTGVFGNDGPFYISGGNLYPLDDATLEIEMTSETIIFDIYDEYFEVDVTFDFRNSGETKTIIVGFPYYVEGGGDAIISNFRSWTNGEAAVVEKSPIVVKSSSDDYQELNLAYTREITFPAGKKITTRVSYRSEFGRGTVVSYLFGTGRYWHNPIGKMHIVVKNHTDRWIYRMSIGSRCPGTWRVRWRDDYFMIDIPYIEPNETDRIVFELDWDYIYRGIKSFPASYYLDRTILTEEDLNYLSLAQLRLLRNTIYAYHGYRFRSKDLNEYFGKTDWYTPDSNFTESKLNEYEKCNVQIIRIIEQQRKQ
jgi:hypothetical protein